MNRRAVLRGLMTAAATLPLAGCWLFPAEWHKKITVIVNTPAGEVSGSVVRYEKLAEDPVLHSANSTERGEAVVVEVLPGKFLFALIEDNKPQDELLFFPGEAPLASTYKLKRMKGKPVTVPESHYPMLVTFTDITDPKSVVEVKPDELDRHFGPGVQLKAITLEITDDPVTEGAVEKVLPLTFFQNWASNHKDALSRGLDDPYFNSLSSEMNRDRFIKEQVK